MKDSLGRGNRSIPDKPCEACGKIFRPVGSKIRTCSRECGFSIRKTKSPKPESWWKTPKGYIEGRVLINGRLRFKKQHRWIVENLLGRELLANEDVHHINGIKDDNRPENLLVINHSEHTRITNQRPYKKGYKLKLTQAERQRRAKRMLVVRKAAIAKATA